MSLPMLRHVLRRVRQHPHRLQEVARGPVAPEEGVGVLGPVGPELPPVVGPPHRAAAGNEVGGGVERDRRGVVSAVHPVQLRSDVQAQHDAGQVGVSGWYRVGLGRRGMRLQPPRRVDQQASSRLLPLTRRARVEVGQAGGAGQAEGGEEVGEHADRDLAVLSRRQRITGPSDQVGGHVTGEDRVPGDERGSGTCVRRPLRRVLPEQAGARVRRDPSAQPGPAALRPGVLVGREQSPAVVEAGEHTPVLVVDAVLPPPGQDACSSSSPTRVRVSAVTRAPPAGGSRRRPAPAGRATASRPARRTPSSATAGPGRRRRRRRWTPRSAR